MQFEISPDARDRLSEILEQSGQKLRVSVLGGGCFGFQYEMSLVDCAEPDDAVIREDAAEVYIDEVSQPFLEGSVLHFERELVGSRFVLKNPNVDGSCGCGESFSVPGL